MQIEIIRLQDYYVLSKKYQGSLINILYCSLHLICRSNILHAKIRHPIEIELVLVK